MNSHKNRVVLGLNAYSHDSGVALLHGGRLVFAASEERYDRIKHSPLFPSGALHAALDHAGLTPADVDLVAFPWRRDMARFRKALYVLRHLPRSAAFFRERPASLPPRMRYLRNVANLDRDLRAAGIEAPVRHVDHHLAHAAQAHRFGPSARAALITADGLGEWTAAATWRVEDDRPRCLRERCYPHSLGKFYAAITQHLGFRPDGGEGKTMGLAPYGRDAMVETMRRVLRPDADALYTLDLKRFEYPLGHTQMTGPAFADLFGPARRREDSILPIHEDLAKAAQVGLEEAVLDVARRLRAETDCDHLGLAGGIFLNCVLNARLRAEAGFDSLFVFPAAGDSGAAAGAAALAADLPRSPLRHAYLGDEFGPAEIDRAIGDRPHVVVDDPCDLAAEGLAAGKLVGWFGGRMEFGPRALGARSILADAREPDIQDRVNRTVKFREDFRPLAPAVLLEAAPEWFDDAEPSPFMLRTFQARSDRRERIPGVVHVDGSARVQTVGPDDGHPRFRSVLERFRDRTGVPLVVNTSFNVRGQPIVRTPAEAIEVFERTALDLLVLEDRVLFKHAPRR